MTTTARHLLDPVDHLIVRTPYWQLVEINQPLKAYLFGLSNYTEDALDAGVSDPDVLKMCQLTDQVDYEVRMAIAHRHPHWVWLNKALWAFLADHQPTARECIHRVLAQTRQALLKNEWYEIMPAFEAVRLHTEKTISIQHYPYKTKKS